MILKKEAAERLTIDITIGKSSTSRTVPIQAIDNRPQTKLLKKVAHNISIRLKDNESEFIVYTTKCRDEYVDNYRQIARDYELTDIQNL